MDINQTLAEEFGIKQTQVDNTVKLIAKENGNDGRGCLVAAQTMVVTGRGYGAAEEILIFVHTLDKGGQEYEELCILGRCLAGLEEVFTAVCA